MKKTLGGDRLGTGRKMQVDIQEHGRSTHNMSYIWRSTMACGTLVPFINEVALPGDTFDIDLDSDIKTHPTIGPLFGSYKAQYDVFISPIRLYNGLLHNNPVDLGMHMDRVKLPRIVMQANPFETEIPLDEVDLDNSQINPSCLLAYLGIRGVGWAGSATELRNFNATAILVYWDIVKNYYTNKQEEIAAVLHTPAEALVTPTGPIQRVLGDTAPLGGSSIPVAPAAGAVPFGPEHFFDINFTIPNTPKPEQIIINTTIGQFNLQELVIGTWILQSPGNDAIRAKFDFMKFAPAGLTVTSWQMINPSLIGVGKPAIATFPLTNLDDMRTYLLENISDTPVVIANPMGGGPNLIPYRWLAEQPNGIPNALATQEGLALKTYQSDQFNNWLNTEWIDGTNGINEVTAISVTDDQFTVEQLIMSNKVYMMLNAIMVSGGTYYDWQETVYGTPPKLAAETPMYMGGLSKELVFQEVVSNSESGGQPLGTLAGKGVLAKKHKGGKVVIKVSEASYIMGIVSLTPRIDYSQGNKWDTSLLTLDDLHKPWLDGIGFQDLITEKMAWWDTQFDDGEAVWVTKSAGKQPAWMDYMTNNNRTYGNFAIATNEMFMTLNRRYEPLWDGAPTIKDLTTYIDPSKFNFIFAETSLDAQNFWVQIAVDMEVRRVMSARIMPNL